MNLATIHFQNLFLICYLTTKKNNILEKIFEKYVATIYKVYKSTSGMILKNQNNILKVHYL